MNDGAKTARAFQSAFGKTALAVLSLVVTYLILELVVFRLYLPYLPRKLHGYLPRGIQSLAQSSKTSVLPKDYVALVGDSYAQGFGDWVLGARLYANPPYHSGHVLHSKLNVDVVTFGRGGVGSLSGIVGEPIAQWQFVNSTGLFSLEPPKEILVYFYSGNDLNNNLHDLRRRSAGRYPMDQVQDADVFRRFIDDVVLSRNDIYVQSKNPGWSKNFFLARTVYNIVFREGRRRVIAAQQAVLKKASETSSKPVNWAMIGRERAALPGYLQAPSLELTSGELKLGAYVFEQALLYLGNFFSRSRIRVLYVPSPLESYEIVSAEVDAQSFENRGRRFSSAFLAQRSAEVRQLIEAAAQRHGFPFVDATPFIREASRKDFVHGPKDWTHFNRIGYEALAEAGILALTGKSSN